MRYFEHWLAALTEQIPEQGLYVEVRSGSPSTVHRLNKPRSGTTCKNFRSVSAAATVRWARPRSKRGSVFVRGGEGGSGFALAASLARDTSTKSRATIWRTPVDDDDEEEDGRKKDASNSSQRHHRNRDSESERGARGLRTDCGGGEERSAQFETLIQPRIYRILRLGKEAGVERQGNSRAWLAKRTVWYRNMLWDQ